MIFWLAACAAAPPCADGYTERADGSCWREVAAPWEGDATVEEALDALPACAAHEGDGRIDVDAGCFDGACVNATAVEISAALGAEPTCTPYLEPIWNLTYADCTWPTGVYAWFADFDADGVPDADATTTFLTALAPYDGTSADGLGLDAGFACFHETFGAPRSVSLVHDGDAWRIGSLTYEDPGVYLVWDPDAGPWDGTPTTFALTDW